MPNKIATKIRDIEPHEYDVLDEFLYHAIYFIYYFNIFFYPAFFQAVAHITI